MQQLPEFKAADLTRHTSDLFDAAIRSPVAITKHRKPKFVLMSIDQYHQLARKALDHQGLEIWRHLVKSMNLLSSVARELVVLVDAHQHELWLARFGDGDG